MNPARPTCLPLEAVLIGTCSSGNLHLDLRNELDVSDAWIAAFYAGFALAREVDSDQEGYPVGAALPERHYPSAGGIKTAMTELGMSLTTDGERGRRRRVFAEPSG